VRHSHSCTCCMKIQRQSSGSRGKICPCWAPRAYTVLAHQRLDSGVRLPSVKPGTTTLAADFGQFSALT